MERQPDDDDLNGEGDGEEDPLLDPLFVEEMNKRNTLAVHISRLKRRVESGEFQRLPTHALDMQLSALNQYWKKFEELSMDMTIQFGTVPVRYELLDATREDVAREVIDVRGKIEKRLTELSEPAVVDLKPSEIVIPKFHGDRTCWPAWKAQFVGKVLEAKIPKISKLDLLLRALRGAAQACAGSSELKEPTDLDRIWGQLCQVYDNRYQLVRASVEKILDVPSMSSRTTAGFRMIIDTTQEQLRVLKRFDCKTDEWGPIICCIILRKIDDETQREWARRRDLDSLPDLKALMEFLERECQATTIEERSERDEHTTGEVNFRKRLGPPVYTSQSYKHFKRNTPHTSSAGGKQHMPRHFHEGRRSDQGQENKPPNATEGRSDYRKPVKCRMAMCGKMHRPWECDDFRGAPLEQRQALVSGWGICKCCLIMDHDAEDCPKPGCPIKECNRAKHNSMLCPRRHVFQAKIDTDKKHSWKAQRSTSTQ